MRDAVHGEGVETDFFFHDGGIVAFRRTLASQIPKPLVPTFGRSPYRAPVTGLEDLHASAISRREAPELCETMSLDKQRAQGMPGARCTRSLACEMKQSTRAWSPQVQTDSTGIPRAMVLRLTSRSPRCPGFFDTVACASYRRIDAGIGASE